MTSSEKLRSLFSRLRDAALPAWRPFNRWRRERWPVRVIILVMLGAYSIAGSLPILKLMRMAIDGILGGSEPALVIAGARACKAQEADRLRRALRAYLDADRDGMIRAEERARAQALGMDPAHLDGPVLKADLNSLVDAARRAGLVSASCTARRIRRQAFYVGRSEAEDALRPYKAEIEQFMARGWRVPGNWSVSSWWRGAVVLFSSGMHILGVADWLTAVGWLFLCYFAARLAVILAGEGARRFAPSATPGLILVLGVLAWLLHKPDWNDLAGLFFDWLAFFVRTAGWAAFSFCAAYAGSRRVRAEEDRTTAALRTVAGLGGVIFAWGILSMFFWVALYKLGAWRLPSEPWALCPFFESGWDVFLHSGYFMTWGIPLSVKVLGVIAGASMIAYATVRMRKIARAAAP